MTRKIRDLFPLTVTLFVICLFTAACSAQQQTEQQALDSLRDLARGGKLPPESVAADIEKRFAGKTAGTLAKLLRARIRFDAKDYAAAAAILNSPDLATRTSVGDHALWLRGTALQLAGDHRQAMAVFEQLANDHPDSIRTDEGRISWAASAIAAGRAADVPEFLAAMIKADNGSALLAAAKAYESLGRSDDALTFYRRTFFSAAGSNAAKEAETKLTALGQPLQPRSAEEASLQADNLFRAKSFAAADRAFTDLAARFPAALSSDLALKRIVTLINVKKFANAKAAVDAMPAAAAEKENALYELTVGYAKARMWADARRSADEIRQRFPNGKLTPAAWVNAGYAARDAKLRSEEQYFLRAALLNFPKAVEVAGAQFELAWLEHEAGNFAESSKRLIEHLAFYADKDTSNRGKAGYWAARDAERAGRIEEACALYDAVVYRYSANWYGTIGFRRLATLRSQGKCAVTPPFGADSNVPAAAANLKTVTVAPETATARELERAEKSEQLASVGLFDWSFDELREAKKTADQSPKINLALARYYRMKGDNVNALLALAKSYPDYAQMFPEELTREEWEIFYPLIEWPQISAWAKNRGLDPYLVAGLIRQESVFNPRARSGANAYGLMQLLLPTARLVARKYGTASPASAEDLYQPAMNIELGTGYMRDQLDKFGRVEYMAVAYNAGPGRVPQWRASLPLEMDEFVEAIPFKETRGYVQGVTRNTAQYRRLYDENGRFKPNVGTRPLRGEIDTRDREQMAAELPEVQLLTAAE